MDNKLKSIKAATDTADEATQLDPADYYRNLMSSSPSTLDITDPFHAKMFPMLLPQMKIEDQTAKPKKPVYKMQAAKYCIDREEDKIAYEKQKSELYNNRDQYIDINESQSWDKMGNFYIYLEWVAVLEEPVKLDSPASSL